MHAQTRPPEIPFPVFGNQVLGVTASLGRLDELHLYHGARCNRACAFCCVSGAPEADHTPFTRPVLQAAVNTIAPGGSLKIYGGEPTLDAQNLYETVATLRALRFAGAITVFSNGLRARVLTTLLDSDENTRVVLNQAIVRGDGEKPLPRSALAHLRAYHQRRPGYLFLSHDFAVPVGRQPERTQEISAPCWRCWPTLTSAGRFHACPFAVTYDRPHYDLGDITNSPQEILARFEKFLAWVDRDLNPRAARQKRSACAVCIEPTPRLIQIAARGEKSRA